MKLFTLDIVNMMKYLNLILAELHKHSYFLVYKKNIYTNVRAGSCVRSKN